VSRYAVRAFVAQVRRGLSLYLLTLLGVALGVGSIVCIQVINENAVAAFAAGIQAVSGEADLSVVGRTPTFPEALYAEVLAEAGVRVAWPLYRVDVALAEGDGVFLDVLGVDLTAPLRLPWRGEPADLAAALDRPGWIAVTPALARRMGWTLGRAFEVSSGSRRARLTVGALVDFQQRSPQASSRLAVMDIAHAQDLLGRPGELQQIDVGVAEGTDPAEVAARLAARLGPGVEVLTPAQREERAAGLLGAFRLNLTALSLISLFVGVFLVHSSTQAALVRRRVELGALRCLGATRGQVLALVLAEVVALGGLGVGAGIPLGYWAARAHVDVVSATLTNLYLLEGIESLRVPAWILGVAAAVGVGGAVAGALGPALDMSRRDPRALLATFTLHERAHTLAGPLAGAAVLLLAGSAAWYRWGGFRWRPAGFVLGLALLLAVPLVTPALVRGVAGLARVRAFGWGLSLRGLGAQLQTTAFAVAALAVAVSMLVGITVMIESFRRTLEVWVRTTVQADVYVTTRSWGRGGGGAATLDDRLVAALAAHPGVRFVDRLRKLVAQAGDRRIAVSGVDMALPGREERFALLAGDPATAVRRAREEGAVLVSEPLARKTGLGVGQSVALGGPHGELRFPIAGIYYDYSTEGGAVVMDLATMGDRFGPGAVQSLALYLEPGGDPERMVDEVRARFAGAPLVVRSNRRLREEIFTIFDQTFAVTRILQGMSLLIAVSGITLTLLILARERAAELALCRALGARRDQLFRVFVGQGLGMGLLGVGLGLLGGAALAGILILVINRAYFGWTIQAHPAWAPVAEEVVLILGAAVLASLYPALRASRTPATELSREDT
jgi:putative ABC transport system permease protein